MLGKMYKSADLLDVTGVQMVYSFLTIVKTQVSFVHIGETNNCNYNL